MTGLKKIHIIPLFVCVKATWQLHGVQKQENQPCEMPEKAPAGCSARQARVDGWKSRNSDT